MEQPKTTTSEGIYLRGLIKEQLDFEKNRVGTDGSIYDSNTVEMLLARGVMEEITECLQGVLRGDLESARVEAADVFIFSLALLGHVGEEEGYVIEGVDKDGVTDVEINRYSRKVAMRYLPVHKRPSQSMMVHFTDNGNQPAVDYRLMLEEAGPANNDIESEGLTAVDKQRFAGLSAIMMQAAFTAVAAQVRRHDYLNSGEPELAQVELSTVKEETVAVLMGLAHTFSLLGLSPSGVKDLVDRKLQENEDKYKPEYFRGVPVKEGIRRSRLEWEKKRTLGASLLAID